MEAEELSKGEKGYGALDLSAGSNKASNFGPCVSNFCIQYNFTAAAFAVTVASSSNYLGKPMELMPSWASEVTQSAVFLGAMVGMLCMGALGDTLGRVRAMELTLVMSMLGILVCTCAAGSPDCFYSIVCVGRLLLGAGVGGIYPLSAVTSAEGEDVKEQRSSVVSSAFIWQFPGMVAPYLLAMLLLAVQPKPPQEWAVSLQFRLLFGLGIVPAVAAYIIYRRKASEAGASKSRESCMQVLQKLKGDTRLTLIGTAGTWFLFDIVAYGNQMFTPTILLQIYGSSTSLFRTALQSAVAAAIGFPGVLIASWLVKSWGCRRLNIVGFCCMALVCAVMGLLWNSGDKNLLFAIFCVLNFCTAFGPSVGTYVLPAICYPMQMRSTCHGISATSGKTGALVGTLLFPIINRSSVGLPGVLCMQCGCGLLGALLSYCCLKDDWEYADDGEDTRCSTP